MDLVDFSEERFREIEAELRETQRAARAARRARDPDVGAARRQRRRARRSAMPWYDGPTLLEHLETVEIAGDRDLDAPALPGAVGDPADVGRAPRLPRLRRPGRGRRLARRRRGRRAPVGPADARSRRSRRSTAARRRRAGQSVTIRLEDDLDVSRGDMLADPEQAARRRARARRRRVCWMSEQPLEPRARLAVKHTTRTVRAIVDELVSVRRHPHARGQAGAGAPRAERHRASCGCASPSRSPSIPTRATARPAPSS